LGNGFLPCSLRHPPVLSFGGVIRIRLLSSWIPESVEDFTCTCFKELRILFIFQLPVCPSTMSYSVLPLRFVRYHIYPSLTFHSFQYLSMCVTDTVTRAH
jgi:hypothetical protein